jgi:integral membrane protein (TIGR01906 family)
MMKKYNWTNQVTGWVSTLLVLPMLLVTSILMLLNPIFLDLEYRRPGFPADPFGFTLKERLEYARVSVAYLVNNQGIDYLKDQHLSDSTSLFNERELSHMVDVKAVVQGAIRWWLVGLIVFGLLTWWAFKAGRKREYWRALSRGGFLTLGIIVIFLAYLAINFDSLFTRFHSLFFESGTWVFLYTDSLIRLFPLPFWQDCFIVVGSLSLLGGALLGWQGRKRSLQKTIA